MATQTIFETEPCTRCGGTGHYSRCEMYGTTCFKCAGAMVQLTQRGKAALGYLKSLLPKREAGTLEVGETYRVRSMPARKIVEIQRDWLNRVILVGPVGYSMCVEETYEVDVIPSTETLATLQAQALAYQSTLTKAGKPRKG